MATKKAKKKSAPKKVDFNKLSPTQKRVAIAEDVISALKVKKYKATTGQYVRSSASAKGVVDKGLLKENGSVSVNVQDALKKNLKTCDVCAKGAMFVASVERFNQLHIEVERENDSVLNEFDDNSLVCDHLSNYFDQDQLDLIEKAFEGAEFIEGNYGVDGESEEDWAAVGYSYKYPKADDRMSAIMANVVRNKGKFVCTPAELLNNK